MSDGKKGERRSKRQGKNRKGGGGTRANRRGERGIMIDWDFQFKKLKIKWKNFPFSPLKEMGSNNYCLNWKNAMGPWHLR